MLVCDKADTLEAGFKLALRGGSGSNTPSDEFPDPVMAAAATRFRSVCIIGEDSGDNPASLACFRDSAMARRFIIPAFRPVKTDPTAALYRPTDGGVAVVACEAVPLDMDIARDDCGEGVTEAAATMAAADTPLGVPGSSWGLKANDPRGAVPRGGGGSILVVLRASLRARCINMAVLFGMTATGFTTAGDVPDMEILL